MIVSIHQPAYLPWLGYLDRLSKSNKFVFLDTVQFEKNSFTNRNKIKTANGEAWLTIPVRQKGHINSILLDLEIDTQKNWRSKHINSIQLAYAKAPYFKGRFERLRETYTNETIKLADFCYNQLLFWRNELGLETEIIRASELGLTQKKSDLVLEICQKLGAKTYFSGPMGKDYLNTDMFKSAGIEVAFQSFSHPVYRQLHGDFVPAMGIVDYWLNCEKMGAIG